ncbi:hypothetical protein DL764_009357 [Monosporascus ibericus]|uniref:Importin N-terminal domain-containing protein n=1 Tax=Monosporascus ibericus TaxID=155417 RepID=A0A4Q4SY27_9PEZI|nr:hypothetical protein DL764_009357 [Monosporascus ibericus]
MDIRTPRTLDEVEELINRLYGSTEEADARVQIQEVLQRFQKSPEGWQLSQALMARPGDNIKVFGVLTIIVKLNTESLPDDTALSVLQNIISWLLNALHEGSGPYVIKKLCSALVTHFTHYYLLWPDCIRHLVHCLYSNQSGLPGQITPSIMEMGPALTPEKTRSAIWFCMVLAEEAERFLQFGTPQSIAVLERIARNATDATSLMAQILKPPSGPVSLPCQQVAIKCLYPWIVYAHKASKRTIIADLQTLVQSVMECLVVDDLYEPIIQLLTDTLEDWETFFTPEHISTLYAFFMSPWAQQRYQALCQGTFDSDSVKFGIFLLAFANSQQRQLMNMTDERAMGFLGGLTNLLKIDCSFMDDEIFVPALEFWGQFVESLSMEYPSDSFDWDQPPLLQIRAILSCAWRKLQYPDPEVVNAWDPAERNSFNEARKDLADLIQYVHTMAGRPLVSLFAECILQALDRADWAEVEAATFCLGTLVTTGNRIMSRAYDRADHPATPVTSVEVSVLVAIRALRCLCSIAKGLQGLSESADDLDPGEEARPVSSFPGVAQMHIDIMLKDVFSAQSEVVEVLCSILRAGFSETEPGPFVFPPEMVTAFITSTWHNRIPAVVNTASAFLSSLHHGKQKQHVSQALTRLLPWVLELLSQLPNPDDEPELTQYCIEFLQRAMIRRPDIFMSQSSDSLEFVFTLALKLLDGNEPLPKAAAAEFWAAFIPLKSENQDTQAAIDSAIVQLGPAISRSLVQSVGGKAARSQLDKLSDPLKRLVVQHPDARHWLEDALNDPSFPGEKATRSDKTMFLKKVLSLRGQRGTNQVVKDFWLASRGLDT